MDNKKINVVSLFSGIGGFEEGLRIAKINANIVFASEIDKYAQESYISNFGSENLHGDITKINETDIPDHSLLLAGFPCQSFSITGLRRGFEDTRGTLFFDVVRILNEKKPKYILLENVKNLASHDQTKTIRTILHTLSDLGYSVDFTVINSAEAGVPQNRDRTYICGILNGKTEKYLKDTRNTHIWDIKENLNSEPFNSFNFFDKVVFQDKKKHLKDVLLDTVDEKYYLTSVKVEDFLSTNTNLKDINKTEEKIVKLFDLPREVHNDLERQRRVYSTKGISPTVLARSDTTKIYVEENGRKRIRKVTPEENFYIQGFSKSFVKKIKSTGMSVTQMYKQSGNAVSPPVIAGILSYLYNEYIKIDESIK